MAMLDLILLFLVVGGAILGAWRGFSTEMLALLAWVAAIAALKLFYAPVRAMLGEGAGGAVLAFLIVAALPFFGVKLAAGAVGGSVKRSLLGPLDRGLGLGFGALKGLMIATLGFLLFTLGHDTLFGGDSARPAWMREARSYTLLDATSRAVVDFVEARRKGAR